MSEVDDLIAKELVAEVFLVELIPKSGTITTFRLIEETINEANRIGQEFNFDFSLWARATILEVVDYLIACGAIDGPLVDIANESELLLNANLSCNSETEKYIKELLREVWEYTPSAKGAMCPKD